MATVQTSARSIARAARAAAKLARAAAPTITDAPAPVEVAPVAPPVEVAPPVAPVEVDAPAVEVAPLNIANMSGDEQAGFIIMALSAPFLKVAAAALAESSGRVEVAATLVSDRVTPTLIMIKRILPILRSPAPSALFTDRNNHGARVGELFAARLGVGAIYRDASKTDLKAARAALVAGAK